MAFYTKLKILSLSEVPEIKHIPNIITASRIALSVSLLLIEPLSFGFFIIYLLCGISDIFDGYIARKTKNISQFGATFDSVADAVFIGILLVIFIPILPWPLWLLYWIGIITLIRFVSLGVGFAKYHAFAFLHTYSNKLTGLLLFSFLFLYNILGLTLPAVVLCVAATLSAIEELAINITSKELSRDTRSIFKK